VERRHHDLPGAEERDDAERIEKGRTSRWDEAFFRREIEGALSILLEEEAAVVRWLFGLSNEEPKSLKEIGALIGKSVLDVDEIRWRAISKMRRHFGEGGAGMPAWVLPRGPGPLSQAREEEPPREGESETCGGHRDGRS
jgi:hypothetical protein